MKTMIMHKPAGHLLMSATEITAPAAASHHLLLIEAVPNTGRVTAASAIAHITDKSL
jgi:hypothetical protein